MSHIAQGPSATRVRHAITSGSVRMRTPHPLLPFVFRCRSLRANAPSSDLPESSIYMALFSYLIAFGHFTSETRIFRTTGINLPALSPVIVSSIYFSYIPSMLTDTYSYTTGC
jgi:hypothetical protein